MTTARIDRLQASVAGFFSFMTDSTYARRHGEPTACDFALGNPHEMPLPGVVTALTAWAAPRSKDWFAYTMSSDHARAAVKASLKAWRGVDFEVDDIAMTNGGFAAISVALHALVEAGDEVVYVDPPWFFYEALILAAGAQPVAVRMDDATFDLDLAAIQAAITPRTRAVLINSPHNPTGKIYPQQTLERLAGVLAEASNRHGRPIYLLSDEAYSRIVFDGRRYPSPTASYPYALLLYTYGKTLLTPGQRIGYIALPPTMPDRPALRQAIFMSQLVTGFAFPNALLQHALVDLERQTVDIGALQHRRDRVVAALRSMGYSLHAPEGTFYLTPRSPLANDSAFVDLLAQSDVFVLPGSIVKMPGYVRLSLTANDDMVDRALPVFAKAIGAAGRP